MTARYFRVMASLASMLLVTSVSARAQDRASVGEDPSPRVEIGAAASSFMPPGMFGLGGRVSIARKEPFAFEVGIDWMELGRQERYVDQLIWFYYWEVKQTLPTHDADGPRFFVTYGAGGRAERTSRDGKRFSAAFIPPLLPMIGFGGEHAVARHATVRVEAQLVWLLGTLVQTRFTGGVTIPIFGDRRTLQRPHPFP